MMIRTRFAPSPTGLMHLGHALAARVAFTLARQSNGVFHLRHEDIDGPRVREEFYNRIEEDLNWLGLNWDGDPLRQTSRIPAYTAALQTLRERKLIYPCFCTRREIQQEWARIGAAPHGENDSIYPATCRNLSAEEAEMKIASDIPYAWRLDTQSAAKIAGPLVFQDLHFGKITVNPDALGDVVLARKDIGTAYHLAVVVDDAFQKITHVTRGEDLLASTHIHRLLQALLDLPEPIYHHHPLVLDEHGQRLAKRNESQSIAALRAGGMTPSAVLALTESVFQKTLLGLSRRF